MSKRFPRTIYKGHADGTLCMVSKGIKHYYDELVVNDIVELEAGEKMGYIDSYHDAIFGIDEPEVDDLEEPEVDDLEEPEVDDLEEPEVDDEETIESDSEADEEF